MSAPTSVILHGFAYGEHLEGLPPRSLGYRLIAATGIEPWAEEVETLARRLQGAPYSDHWPPNDLFCSVLLADGHRLVAVARYGLVDHTPSQRRGGLELIGAIAPADLGVSSALAVYRWLKSQREQAGDALPSLGHAIPLTDILEADQATPTSGESVPVLPIQLWQEGTLLFAATSPSDPDHRLSLLESNAGQAWQWLPLVGPDFPFTTYAQRGPLVAWAPHLTDVAVKVDRQKTEVTPPPVRRSPTVGILITIGLFLVAGFLAANLWLTFTVRQSLQSAAQNSQAAPAQKESPAATKRETARSIPKISDSASRERYVEELHDLLQDLIGQKEWAAAEAIFLARYEQVVRRYPQLRLDESNHKGKVALGAVEVLSGRNANRVVSVMREAMEKKGFDPGLIERATELVRLQLLADMKKK